MGIYIYTLVRNGEVIYVGQTTNPRNRLRAHRRRFRGVEMKIIRTVQTIAHANRIEGQVTRAYFNKGLAAESVDCMPVLSRPGFPKYRIGKQEFYSKQHIKRHFGISIHNINGWLKSRRGYREPRIPHSIQVLA